MRAACRRAGGNVYSYDQITRVQIGFEVRGIAWEAMQSPQWDLVFSVLSGDPHRGIEHQQRVGKVTGVGRNALLTRPKDGMQAVLSVDGRTSRSRLTLVARCGHVAKVSASRSLQQVAAKRCKVTHLWERAGEERFCDHRVVLENAGIFGRITQTNESAKMRAIRPNCEVSHTRQSG